MGGDIMIKETIREIIKPRQSESNSVMCASPAVGSPYNVCHEDATPKVRWEQTIIEISLKQGYTGLAL